MPNYKSHLVGGITAYGIAMLMLSAVQKPHLAAAGEWFLCALAGSLFPDIDIKSKGQKLFYSILFFSCILLLLYDNAHIAAFLSVIACLPLLARHRGVFHQFWFVCTLSSIGAMFLYAWLPSCKTILWTDTLFFNAGVLSHIVLDKRLLKQKITVRFSFPRHLR